MFESEMGAEAPRSRAIAVAVNTRSCNPCLLEGDGEVVVGGCGRRQ